MLQRFKLYLESVKVTPVSWLLGVSGVLMVRFFLESLSNPTSSGYFPSDASTLIHYWLFFTSAFVVYMLLLQAAAPSWKKVAPQFIAASSVFIFIAPVLDWVISAGRGFKMTYFFDSPSGFVVRFLTFGGTDFYSGATIGLRIELALMILFFGFLIYSVRKDWPKTIFYSLALYLIILFFASIPGIISWLGQSGHLIKVSPIEYLQKVFAGSSTLSNNLHSSFRYSSAIRLFEISFNFLMGKIFFVLLLILSSAWFLINCKEKFKNLIGDLRSNRTIHFILMIFAGMFLAFSMFPQIKLNWNDWLSVLVLCLAYYFSIRFAICTNDIVDESIDAVSNTDRPLVKKTLTQEDMKQAGFLFLAATIVSGFLAGYTALFFVLTFTALYYIYSAPPTRYKLIPFFASFIIGLCSLTPVLAGFFLISPVKQVSIFPPSVIAAVVIMFTLLTGTRDIKDVEGDKRAGVKTVPVLFGDKWGVRVTGILAALSYLIICLVFKSPFLLITAVPAALLTYYFSARKPFVEKYIFYTYFTFVFLSLLLLFVIR